MLQREESWIVDLQRSGPWKKKKERLTQRRGEGSRGGSKKATKKKRDWFNKKREERFNAQVSDTKTATGRESTRLSVAHKRELGRNFGEKGPQQKGKKFSTEEKKRKKEKQIIAAMPTIISKTQKG